MVDLGFNYRLTDLQCALGSSQLRKLDRFLTRREAIASRYRTAFAGLPGVTLQAVEPNVRHAWHLFLALLDLERLAADRAARPAREIEGGAVPPSTQARIRLCRSE